MPERHPALVTREGSVLVVVDIQERLAAVMGRRDETVATASRLVRVAAILGTPVVVTRQHPRGLGDTVDELHAPLDEARRAGSAVTVVDKLSFDCMAEPAFVAALADTGCEHVVLAGMEAHICVTQTALSLAAAGPTPHVVADAVCSRHDADAATALDRLRCHGVDVLTSESAIYEAVGEAGTERFRAVLQVVKEG